MFQVIVGRKKTIDKHMGDGILIYSLIQFHKYKTLVCLGSGGGFIPRIMSQVKI